MILVIIESFLLNFVLLMVCVMNIRNSPVGGVHWYEKNVQDRVVKLGLITKEQIKKNMLLSFIPFMIVLLILAPMMVFFINGAENFLEGFVQLTVMFEICGIFDRVFIDWYWVGHTKSWVIPGTEDLMPYVPAKAWVKKILGTIIEYPLMAALLSWIMCLILNK